MGVYFRFSFLVYHIVLPLPLRLLLSQDTHVPTILELPACKFFFFSFSKCMPVHLMLFPFTVLCRFHFVHRKIYVKEAGTFKFHFIIENIVKIFYLDRAQQYEKFNR